MCLTYMIQNWMIPSWQDNVYTIRLQYVIYSDSTIWHYITWFIHSNSLSSNDIAVIDRIAWLTIRFYLPRRCTTAYYLSVVRWVQQTLEPKYGSPIGVWYYNPGVECNQRQQWKETPLGNKRNAISTPKSFSKLGNRQTWGWNIATLHSIRLGSTILRWVKIPKQKKYLSIFQFTGCFHAIWFKHFTISQCIGVHRWHLFLGTKVEKTNGHIDKLEQYSQALNRKYLQSSSANHIDASSTVLLIGILWHQVTAAPNSDDGIDASSQLRDAILYGELRNNDVWKGRSHFFASLTRLGAIKIRSDKVHPILWAIVLYYSWWICPR